MYPNYPNQPGYPPNQPPYGGGYGMPQPSGIGFGDAGQPGYPPAYGGGGAGGFPIPGAGGGYPSQPSYPGGGGGYPPPQPGYPGAGGPTYPSQPGGYPGYQQPAPSVNNFLPDHIAHNPNFQPSYPGGGGGTTYAGAPVYPGAGGGTPTYPGVGGGAPVYPGGAGASYPGGSYGGGSSYQGRPPANPVVRPYQPFNPNDDAQRLYKAMKGFGTDETTLIDILCRRTSQQRQEIAHAYKSSIGKDLLKNLESELRGNMEMLFRALVMTPTQLEAYDLHEAIQGFGTKEATIIDIVCTKANNHEMNELKNMYRQMYHKDMENELRGDVSGYFQRFLVSLIAANRSEAGPDYGRAAQQAKELHQAGEKQLGTNEVVFNRIFATESYAQLCAIFEEYRKLTGHDIEKAIKSEMSGDVERAFLAVAQVARNPAGYFAQRLHETMAGAGTHDRALIRNMVLRSEIDMMDIKVEFQRRYGKTLESFIRSDCSGDYRRALLCLAGDLNWKS